MSNWIRVRDTSGHEISVRGDVPEGHPLGVKPGQKVLDKPAANSAGHPLPPKIRTRLGEPLPGSAVAQRRERRTQEPVPDADPATGESGHEADPDKEN